MLCTVSDAPHFDPQSPPAPCPLPREVAVRAPADPRDNAEHHPANHPGALQVTLLLRRSASCCCAAPPAGVSRAAISLHRSPRLGAPPIPRCCRRRKRLQAYASLQRRRRRQASRQTGAAAATRTCSLSEMPRTGPRWMRFIKCCGQAGNEQSSEADSDSPAPAF